MSEKSSIRIKNLGVALSSVGTFALVVACSTGRSNHPLPAITRDTPPVARKVTTDKQSHSNQFVRSIDFANFSFPWPHDLGDSKKTFKLRDGELKPTRDKKGMVDEMGVTLASIVYGDLTKDGVEEAIVVLSIITGGSAIPHAVYIYGWHNDGPKLLWAFATGDRGAGGLRQAYAENGQLVVELYGKDKLIGKKLFGMEMGVCCPKVFTRARYDWRGNKFRPQGAGETLPNPEGHGSPVMQPYRPSSWIFRSKSLSDKQEMQG
jgi:hypothetical protein